MRLEMHSQMARIGIRTENAKVSMRQPKQTLDLNIIEPEIEIKTTRPKVEIDQSQPFAESGLKGNKALLSDYIQYAMSKFYEGIGRAVEQGNQMADIHKSTNVIAENADANAFDQFATDYNVETMPKSRPEITVTPGTVDVQLKRGRVENNTKQVKPEINYQRGKVEIYMRQKNYLEIRVVGDKFDARG